jgi:hypothetical protein
MTQPNISVPVFSGARGTISDITTSSALVRYNSDQAGATLPFCYRNDLAAAPGKTQLAETSDFISVWFSYGQSWRSHSLPIDWAGLGLSNYGEEFFAFAPQVAGGNDLLPQVGDPVYSAPAVPWDLRGLSWKNTENTLPANAGGSIGRVAARTFVALNKRAGYPRIPVVDVGTAYPGYTWDQLKPGTSPWTATLQSAAKVKTANTAYGKTTRYLGVGWTHGAFSDGDAYDYFTKLTEMKAAFDDLALNGFTGGSGDPLDPTGAANGALHYFTDQNAVESGHTHQYANTLRQVDFWKADPARVHLVGPRYPYGFSDEIHHSGLGYAQYGELEGLAKFYTHTYGMTWDPLYVVSATVSGNKVLVNTSAPMFGFSDLALDTKQIELAPQHGFHVRVAGIERIVTGVAVAGIGTIELTLAVAIPNGTVAEVSYAWYGPGSTPGVHSGVWGNVKRTGPPSVWFANKTIDTWLCAYKATITAA